MDTGELLEYMRTGFLSGRGLDSAMLSDDVVIEWPFAAPGRPDRIEGRAAFEAMAGAALPFRLDEFEVRAVHETAEAGTVVIEYRLGGVVAGTRRAAAFVAVVRQRDGRITHWREYSDTFAMTQAMAAAASPEA